ncbi:MAG: hypothetical protein IPH37_07620 [Burkholderiales bacterium]|nr:hypothetical protein [Burkholderiales bacterium]
MKRAIRSHWVLPVLCIAVPLVADAGYHLYWEAQHGASATRDGLHMLLGAMALVVLGALAFTTARRIRQPLASPAHTADDHLALSQRVEELSRRLVRTQEETRQRFSQELHDRTSPTLAALRINLDIIANTVKGAHPNNDSGPGNALADRIEDSRALIEDTNASIREICAGLHPAAIERGGILGVIQSHALQFAKRTGIQTQVPRTKMALQPDLELALFRVFQEALTNCAKHAHATSVVVRLQLDARPIFLAISDNGNGFDTHDTTLQRGLGLVSMRETVELAGGQLRVTSQPGARHAGSC